jgi:hypothetical protein
MRIQRPFVFVLLAAALLWATHPPDETIPWDVIQKIRVEAIENSEVMNNASTMADVFGPRLANSPSYLACAKWAVERFKEYGLANAMLDPYGEFGVSWSNEFTSVHMITPFYMPIIAYPNTWCKGTDGVVRGKVVAMNFNQIRSKKDLVPFQGKLKGAFVFIEPIQKLSPDFKPLARRFTKDELDKLAQIEIFPREREERRKRDETLPLKEIVDFVFAERAAAIVAPDGRENYGTVMVNEVEGKAWIDPSTIHPPFLVLAAEHYNRILRILEKQISVEMQADIRIAIDNENRTDTNVIAEIPGSDLIHEVVMLGAHLDANSAGQGATDNASGCAVVMEAMRILMAIGVNPRRTIRAALWGGEEYGLLGSRAYVKKHFGDPKTQTYTPDHEKFNVYFNMDGGGGKFRGIYLQGNEGARPIFGEWMRPFLHMGMTHMSNRIMFNSDHSSFLALGLPGFSFIQDPLERRAYHTNMDTYDRLVEEDLIQASIVMAGFAYQAAMSDNKIPRVAPIRRDR